MPSVTAMPDLYGAPAGTMVLATSVLANDSTTGNSPLTASLLAAPANGSVTLMNDGTFSYLPNSGFSGTDTFQYTASDGTDSAAATVTINVTGTTTIEILPGGGAPSLQLTSSSVAENSTTGTLVATLSMSDPNPLNRYTFSLLDDADGRFKIVGNQLQVDDGSQLDYEASDTTSIVIRVVGSSGIPLDNPLTITITDVNETPAMDNDSVMPEENASVGTIVGDAWATDPDFEQTLTYSITAGNTSGAFTIDAATGTIRVANSAAVDFETNPLFTLTVQATDNGAPALSKTATFTVQLVDMAQENLDNLTDAQRIGQLNDLSVDIDELLAKFDPNNEDSVTEDLDASISILGQMLVDMRTQVNAQNVTSFTTFKNGYDTEHGIFSRKVTDFLENADQILRKADIALALTQGDEFRIKGIAADLANLKSQLGVLEGRVNSLQDQIDQLRIQMAQPGQVFNTNWHLARIGSLRFDNESEIARIYERVENVDYFPGNKPPVPNDAHILSLNELSNDIAGRFVQVNSTAQALLSQNALANGSTGVGAQNGQAGLIPAMLNAIGRGNYADYDAAAEGYATVLSDISGNLGILRSGIGFISQKAQAAFESIQNDNDRFREKGVASDLIILRDAIINPILGGFQIQLFGMVAVSSGLVSAGWNSTEEIFRIESFATDLMSFITVLQEDREEIEGILVA